MRQSTTKCAVLLNYLTLHDEHHPAPALGNGCSFAGGEEMSVIPNRWLGDNTAGWILMLAAFTDRGTRNSRQPGAAAVTQLETHPDRTFA